MSFESNIKDTRRQINEALESYLPSSCKFGDELNDAIRYSVLSGGQRFRSLLTVAANALYVDGLDPIPAAVAIEYFHAFTLIHDDLPCLDNAQLRRGVACCHRKFNEATALLAGDTLHALSFCVLAQSYKSHPEVLGGLVSAFSKAALEVNYGQMEDMNIAQEQEDGLDRIHFIYQNKTASLIQAALVMGAITGAANKQDIDLLYELGKHLGFAYQIADDVLDVISDDKSLGKSTGIDKVNGKETYPEIYGIDRSIREAQLHAQNAIEIAIGLRGEDTLLYTLCKQFLDKANSLKPLHLA